jgi:hypothetical protein
LFAGSVGLTRLSTRRDSRKATGTCSVRYPLRESRLAADNDRPMDAANEIRYEVRSFADVLNAMFRSALFLAPACTATLDPG